MTDASTQVNGQSVQIKGERFYRIGNTHLMPEFFMSLVGSSDHWMFISSLGALTAGRCDPDNALFPYAADDQISVARHSTGPFTRILPHCSSDSSEQTACWEPFQQTTFAKGITRNLYKSQLGNKLIFEERNQNLGLVFQYRWSYSEKFGFVRSCELCNESDDDINIDLIDGLQNLMPPGLSSEFTMRFSNLGNAYKKSEKLSGSELGIFYLSSIPTDRAEPSEGLRATVVWQTGLTPNATLLSTEQIQQPGVIPRSIDDFTDEIDVRGKPHAYLTSQRITISSGDTVSWNMIADINQDHADIIALDALIKESPDISRQLERDIEKGEKQLRKIIGSADGFQCGANLRRLDRHIANTTFNLMRGGVPLDNYRIPRKDYLQHIQRFNLTVAREHQETLDSLPENIELNELRDRIAETKDSDLIRLNQEYLPLAFSRRHGDPTRPWNRFSIHLKTELGEPNLTYQGNWRDIFQNWEALSISFPNFGSAMINRFLNATTADGYNAYRITKEGFEWEAPTPDDPWANIGYWGDHQIIYLLKLLEANQKCNPEQLNQQLIQETFVHANIPYRIKTLEEIKADPHNTIDFDQSAAAAIDQQVEQIGSDGKLLRNQEGEIQRVTMLEKILTLTLTKMSNFVPDGGIWLNTQRPEWNDANNALVGNGLSVVTTCYLHRWCLFMEKWIDQWISSEKGSDFYISIEVADLLDSIFATLSRYAPKPISEPKTKWTPKERSLIVNELGKAGCIYRKQLYGFGPTGQSSLLSADRCKEFFALAKQHLKETIINNQRDDLLFHSYNLIRWIDDELFIDHLDEMLEGQVAALSAGILQPETTVDILDALRTSRLYRENQNSYLLYPDKQLPRFLSKNQIPSSSVESSPLLQALVDHGDQSIINQDLRGDYHFNGSIRNSNDLRRQLQELPDSFDESVQQEGTEIINLFVDLFNHRQFTGRSGTFFGYEGLGSIYWHMVSKLGLAVAENLFNALLNDAAIETRKRLRDHYKLIRNGIGSEKTPSQYGAFPSDPYSHTPEDSGVKQPGMTGQVKEDVLSRFLENGVVIDKGCVRFELELFDQEEALPSETVFKFIRSTGNESSLVVPRGGFGFTLCQTPIIYRPSDNDRHKIFFTDGSEEATDGLMLTRGNSKQLFARSDKIERIECECSALKN